MKYLLIICLLFAGTLAFCQQTITVAGEAYLPDARPWVISVISPFKKAVGNEWVHFAAIPVKLDNTFNGKIKLDKAQFIEIHYLGHINLIVYAVPGDSIHVNFKLLSKPEIVKTFGITRSYGERARLSGSDTARIAFFQTLKDRTGSIEEPPFSMRMDTADFYMAFKAKVTAVYKQRLKILEEEAAIHHFSADFEKAAANEIQGEYIANLMFPSFGAELWGKIPPGYFKEVDDYDLTWDKFKNSRSNIQVSYINIKDYNRRTRNQTTEEEFATVFENCTRFKDDSVRNYLLAQNVSRYLPMHPANFDELLQKFREICTNPNYVSGVIALYKPASVGHPLPTSVLNATLKATNGQFTTLKDITPNGKPIFIDFWASWCGPCKKEIPILMQLAEQYRDKIDFRFISLDANDKEVDWLKAIKTTNFKGEHYMIQDKLLTDFAKITSIPRYLVIDKDGKLTTYIGPNLLTDQQGFENTIKAVITN